MVSPLLANVYLHYVFDLWVEAWRSKIAGGDMIFVRYADDLVVGFEYQADAERFLKEFQERLAKFGLTVHPEKTRLIEFGKYARKQRAQRGDGEPETFAFLGFTHQCEVTQSGGFQVKRTTGCAEANGGQALRSEAEPSPADARGRQPDRPNARADEQEPDKRDTGPDELVRHNEVHIYQRLRL